MKSRVGSALAIVLMLLVLPVGVWASDETQTAPAVTESQSKATQSVPMARDVLVASGVMSDDIEPVVPCLQTVDGYMAFQTIAQGKWSGFGWCDEYLPDTGPCRSQFPPVWVCAIPATPHFECVIRDECVWEDFWVAHQIGPFGTPPPDIDFDNYIVIAVVLGMRDNCGYEVEIAAIRATDCGVRVMVLETLLLNTEPRMVNPFHFVKIPKSCVPYRKRVCFDHGSDVFPEEEAEVFPK